MKLVLLFLTIILITGIGIFTKKSDLKCLPTLVTENYSPSNTIPFWFWNGNINNEELSRQIQVMHDAGIREVIIHSRSGLTQEYLSDEWFALVDFTLSELKEREMKAWIYDEFDWPSGRANGKVLEKNPGLVSKILKMKIAENLELKKDKYGVRKVVSIISPDGSKTDNLKDRYCNSNYCDFENKTFYVFYQDSSSYKTEYSMEPYVDLLDPRTTEIFINLTYERYYEKEKKYFGNTIVGFFTDEPGFYADWEEDPFGSIPWSSVIETEFYRRKGYNLTDYLYYIWNDEPGELSERIKEDYFEVLSEAFAENYFGQLRDWTHAHGVMLTGHLLNEENMYENMISNGDFFEPMRYLDIPGSDDIFFFDNSKVTPNLVSSAKYLCKRDYALTEAFAGYGHELRFEEVLNVTSWLEENGVNIIVVHALFYEGNGKIQSNDFPPNFFFQNELLWKHMGDYINRTPVKKHQKVYVEYPIRKAWRSFDPADRSKVDAIDAKFKEEVRRNREKGIIIYPDYSKGR